MGDPANQALAGKLREMADVLEQQQADGFRIAAYRRAANTIEALDRPIREIAQTDGPAGLVVLVFLILWTFTFAIYTVTRRVKTEVRNAPIAFVDEDRPELSQRLRDAFLRPYFKLVLTPAVTHLISINGAVLNHLQNVSRQ
jgi:hypothetical protein